MLERVEKHRKAICEGSATETERMHKRGSEDGGIASMAIAQETFEGGEEFQGQRARLLLMTNKSGL
jgi:hypothetical protein